jgi:hypothetical protein
MTMFMRHLVIYRFPLREKREEAIDASCEHGVSRKATVQDIDLTVLTAELFICENENSAFWVHMFLCGEN